MTNDTNNFYHELKVHLESFQHQMPLPKIPTTLTGIPREGLTVSYQHPADGPADPMDMANEAARVIGAAGAGTVGGAAVGAMIGKAAFGGALARVGVASAGAAVGIPLIAPIALIGGTIGTVAYAAYKIGKGKREHERAEDLVQRLTEHMQGFKPSVEWPEIQMFVSVPGTGLAATWQPKQES